MDTLIVLGAKYFFAVVLLGAITPIFTLTKQERTPYLLRAIFAGFLAFVLTKLAGNLYNDPRPFTQGVKALMAHEADNGFPSDHTVLSFTAAFLSFWASKKLGYVLILIAALVGVCRVLSGVHHTVDVLVGIVIAASSVGISILLMKMVPNFTAADEEGQ